MKFEFDYNKKPVITFNQDEKNNIAYAILIMEKMREIVDSINDMVYFEKSTCKLINKMVDIVAPLENYFILDERKDETRYE